MTGITHHISEPLIAAYAAGRLSRPFALVVAAHVSLCDSCRAGLAAHECAGGAVIERDRGTTLSADLRARVFDGLDTDPPFTDAPAPVRMGPYPGPVADMLQRQEPKWKSLGLGAKQAILSQGAEGSVRLLYIPPGQAVPDHGHNGLELTLVLQGAFRDKTGRFGVGDVEIADDDLDHVPTAEDSMACICLAATDAPLKFNTLVPRLLQPLFRI